MTMILRPYQEEQLQALWMYFMNHNGNPIIAAPTGTGKSVLPAEFIRRTLINYPGQRFIMATHVKELIKQNLEKLLDIWPTAPVGVHSAGLKRRDMVHPIIYGGVQSMYKIAEGFGHRDLMFIDECHLLSPDDTGMYQTLIGVLRKINPHLKIIGMSATPYRMGQGMLTDGGLFTHIAHDLTSLDNFNKLIEDGYLSPLVPRRTIMELDVSNVGIQKGEFIASQLQHEVDKAEITWKGLQELCYHGANRKSWLIYATGIEHANHIAEMLQQMGIECASVHSKQSDEYNTAALRAHRACELRSIVSFSKLTTGLDHPDVDLIGMFRPTLSVPLWVQMLGRGTRPAPGKENCMVLDFAKNTLRLGPINDPAVPRKKGEGGGTIPVKLCENCGVYHHIKAVKCTECGHPFSFAVKIVARAGTEELIRGVEPVITEVFDVGHVFYARKQKTGKAPYIMVTYACGINSFREFVFPENLRFKKPFHDWWKMRHTLDPPATTDEAMQYIAQLRPPKRIRVHTNKMINGRSFPEVLSAEY